MQLDTTVARSRLSINILRLYHLEIKYMVCSIFNYSEIDSGGPRGLIAVTSLVPQWTSMIDEST